MATNPRFLQPTLTGLARFWTEYDHGFYALYTPIAYSLWWCIAACFGVTSAAPYHALSIALHGCNVVLIFAVLRRLLAGRWPDHTLTVGSAIGALLYGLHPMQIESVCWVSGFNNVIAATFSLYALLRLCDAVAAPNGRAAAGWYTMASLGLLLAYFAKPTALVVAPIAGVLLVFLLRVPIRTTTFWIMPWLILALPFIWIAQKVQDVSHMHAPLTQRVLVPADAAGFYVTRLVAPWSVSPDYGRTPQYVLDHWRAQPFWLLGLLILAVAALLWSRFRWLALAMLISAFAIAPTSGITPFLFQSYSTVADRYVYLAMLGPALLLAICICLWPTRPMIITCLCLIAALAVVSHPQSSTWRTNSSWTGAILERNPHSFVAHLVLGGELASAGDLTKAGEHFMTASEVNPDHPRLLYKLGMYYLAMNQPQEALAHLLLVLRENPWYSEAYPIVTAAATHNGTPEIGVAAMQRVVDLRPRDTLAHTYLGSMYGGMGVYDKALFHLQEALRLDPGNEDANRFMSLLYTELRSGKNRLSPATQTTSSHVTE